MNMPGSSERLGFLSELYEWVIATDHSLPKFQGPSSGFFLSLKAWQNDQQKHNSCLGRA